MTYHRKDGLRVAAIEGHFQTMPPVVKAALSGCVMDLAGSGIKGMGEATAKEILFAIGRLMAEQSKPDPNLILSQIRPTAPVK